jgi:hypothetical protein
VTIEQFRLGQIQLHLQQSQLSHRPQDTGSRQSFCVISGVFADVLNGNQLNGELFVIRVIG